MRLLSTLAREVGCGTPRALGMLMSRAPTLPGRRSFTGTAGAAPCVQTMPAPTPTPGRRSLAARAARTPPTTLAPAPLLAASPPATIAIGGHRGLGQNPLPDAGGATPPDRLPPHRENTVSSLLAAAASGATFVEVDAQVTFDGAAVLWHDDVVLCAGPRGPLALPIAGLTLDEFKALNTNPRTGGLAPPSLSSSDSEGWATDGHRLLRAVKGGPRPPTLRTAAAKRRASAAAPWAVAADDELPTLAQACAALPPGLGLNVEVKASSLGGLEPSIRASSSSRALRAEVDRVVEGVLAGLRAAGGALVGRPLLFSSFDARLAAALRRAQGDWPVFLLTEFANPEVGLTAVRLGLQGVVVDAAELLLEKADGSSPPSIDRAAVAALARPPGARLRLATYGAPNDSAAVVAAQAAVGVEAVIADDVGSVVRGLAGGA